MTNKPLCGNKFINLSEVLPLNLPISLMIDPSNLCNFKCTFCPTGEKSLLGKYKRPKGMMSFRLFKKILNDVDSLKKKSSGKIKSLLLYKDGEPLLNRELPEMIALAKELNTADNILVTTNASLLDEEYSTRLLNSGLDGLRVSVQSLKKESFANVTRTKLDYEKIKNNVKNFFEIKKKLKKKTEVTISYVDAENFNKDIKDAFVKEYSNFSDRVVISPVMNWTRSEVHDWTNGIGREEENLDQEMIVCPDPFSRLSVNFDGSVSVCCVDWSHGTVIGDLNNETLEEVWNGERLKEFRLIHLDGRRDKIGPCKNCDYIREKGPHDNIDKIRQDLIEVYS
jgi:radical SAM protein with 4Fe4S-binding SPASM domain